MSEELAIRKTATLVRELNDWRGFACLYKLSVPVTYRRLGDARDWETNHIIVSSVVAEYSGPETYIFPADEEGNALNFLELSGSFRGELDHIKAITDAGYSLE